MIKIEENELFNERYRLISLLGVGGYSQVWLAEDTDINKEVALKIFANNSNPPSLIKREYHLFHFLLLYSMIFIISKYLLYIR